MELRIKMKRVMRSLKQRVAQLDKLRATFAKQVKRAASLGDEEQKRRYAVACAGVDVRKNRTERQVLLLEGMEAIKELVRVDTEFAELSIEMGRAMQGYLDANTLARMEMELERGIAQAEEVDGLMSMVMDSVGDGIMTFGEDMPAEDAEAIADNILAEFSEGGAAEGAEQQIGEELAAIRKEIERKLDDDK